MNQGVGIQHAHAANLDPHPIFQSNLTLFSTRVHEISRTSTVQLL